MRRSGGAQSAAGAGFGLAGWIGWFLFAAAGVAGHPAPSAPGGNGNRALLFPLIGSAFTSSGFGWRQHPVLGGLMLHAGRDLAAPQGTPVVAALGGTVRSAGLAGGYGVAIELDHQQPQRQRTLYGHLSELYVEPGDVVQQGEVIGRVGSTGLSTGPHLHFELRRPKPAAGWRWIPAGCCLTAWRLIQPVQWQPCSIRCCAGCSAEAQLAMRPSRNSTRCLARSATSCSWVTSTTVMPSPLS